MGRTTFRGRVVWLTPEQGGRSSGPPAGNSERDYCVTAFVPPHTVDTGLASFCLAGFETGAWQSSATARWLVVDNVGPQELRAGDIVVVTEGRKTVAYFHVDTISDQDRA